jgi:TonB family protein
METRRFASIVVSILTALLNGCASDQLTPIRVVTITSGAEDGMSHMPPCQSTTPDQTVQSPLPIDQARLLRTTLWQQIPQPPYPAMAQRRGWQGDVLICLVLLEDGTITKAMVQQSSGIPLLDNHTLGIIQSIKRFKLDFDLQSRQYTALIPFRYRLNHLTDHQRMIAASVWARLSVQAAKESKTGGLESAQSGTVILRVTLTTNGEVAAIKLDESSGSDLIDETARKLVMDCSPFPLHSTDPHSPTVLVVPFSYN